jgi:hypothetical protein
MDIASPYILAVLSLTELALFAHLRRANQRRECVHRVIRSLRSVVRSAVA